MQSLLESYGMVDRQQIADAPASGTVEWSGVALPNATGVKADSAKPRLDLLEPEFLVEVAEVMTYGAKKYAPHNWRGGMPWSRLFSAMMRHLWAFWAGEDIDAETGFSHLAHAGCCLMFLVWHKNHRKDLDDRFSTTKEVN